MQDQSQKQVDGRGVAGIVRASGRRSDATQSETSIAAEMYVASFPNVARDRGVWPVIERQIRARFAGQRFVGEAWSRACLESARGYNPGSLALILNRYDALVFDADALERERKIALPAPRVSPVYLTKLMDLLLARMQRKITQAQFKREAEALATEG